MSDPSVSVSGRGRRGVVAAVGVLLAVLAAAVLASGTGRRFAPAVGDRPFGPAGTEPAAGRDAVGDAGRDVVGESTVPEPEAVDLRPAPGEPAPLWAMAPLRVARTDSGALVVHLPDSGVGVVHVPGRQPNTGQPHLPGSLPDTRPHRPAAQPTYAGLRWLVETADREVAGLIRHPAAPLVVVAPATTRQFVDLIGGAAHDRDYGGIAAVTSTVDGSVRADAPVRVLLNPDVFGELGPVAARVVLAHEATHVATGAAAVRMPPWVAEGFADFVALRDGDVPVRAAAGRALAAVRRHGAPGKLPTAADFGTGAPGLGRSYELAWLAFRVLARQAGTPATVAFHRAVVAGRPVDAALRDSAGLGMGQLTRAWRYELVRLASVQR